MNLQGCHHVKLLHPYRGLSAELNVADKQVDAQWRDQPPLYTGE
jgi:hypothetical protein